VPCRACGDVSTRFRRLCLCWRCYRSRSKRQRYVTDFAGTPAGPTVATEAPPGSPEKIAAMAERYQLRLSLHHQYDPRVKLPLKRQTAEFLLELLAS